MGLISRFCKWWIDRDLLLAYLKGWKDGVNQQLYDPESAEHGHMTKKEYYGEE